MSFADAFLRDRWLTPEGQQIRARLVDAFRVGNEAWSELLQGFPRADEIHCHQDLRGIDLSSLDLGVLMAPFGCLDHANLSGCTFTRVTLSCASMVRSCWSNARFAKGAQLSSIVADDADFRGADLSRAFLLDSRLGHANFEKANLTGADLGNARLEDAIFREAVLVGSYLVQCGLQRADLRKANLRQANLELCNLTAADLRGADMTETKLKNAFLDRALRD
jgi:uncharacterized protein YjbI with pentapeptide repeats